MTSAQNSEAPAAPSVEGNAGVRRATGRRALGCLLSFAVVVLGAAVFFAFVRTRPAPAKAPAAERAVPVEVVALRPGPERVQIRAQGNVTPAERVVVQPEVNGRVVWQHKELVPGGRIKKGEPLFRVDPRDYHAALEQQKAQLANSQALLDQEQGRRTIAEHEWQVLNGAERFAEQDKSLALREPQLQSAKATLGAAESALAQAKLNISRTTVVAPFNALVQAENVDLSQLVTQQSQVATLVGTDAFWIQVSIPLEQLAFIDVPRAPGQPGSLARVSQQIGPQRIERPGRVLRLLGDLDPVGRMARVLLEVTDPFGLGAAKNGDKQQPASKDQDLPLLLGAFVDVEIEGNKLPRVLELPRRGLREGNRVFVVRNNVLGIIPVEILWRTEQSVYVRGELSEGERVIVSPMRAVTAGMPLRVIEPTSAAP
jgi:RND family efflux transporter MFP subunit